MGNALGPAEVALFPINLLSLWKTSTSRESYVQITSLLNLSYEDLSEEKRQVASSLFLNI